MIEYTFDHALAARRLTHVLLTSDSSEARRLAVRRGIEALDRPASLADDEATVDAAARHAVRWWESQCGLTVDAVALLYGNIPVRASGLLDRAIEHLDASGADSVRSVAPVSKHHPDWMFRVDGDRMAAYRINSIHRRQDLEPLYLLDGAICVVRRRALFAAENIPNDRQAFLGVDRRALVQPREASVDVDDEYDLRLAEAVLRARVEEASPA